MPALNQILGALPYVGVGGGVVYGANKYDDHRKQQAANKDKKYYNFWSDDPDDPNDISFVDEAQRTMAASPPGSTGSDMGFHAGRAARKFLVNPIVKPGMKTLREGNPWSGAALGGLAGLPIGAIIGLIRNGWSGLLTGALSGGALGALAGGGGSALANYAGETTNGERDFGFNKSFSNPISNYSNFFKDRENFRKGASVKSAGAFGSHDDGRGSILNIQSNIYKSGISHAQQAALANELRGLTPPQKSTLMRLLQGATGAAATYIIAKYLLNLGKRPTIMSMILGGLGSYHYR